MSFYAITKQGEAIWADWPQFAGRNCLDKLRLISDVSKELFNITTDDTRTRIGFIYEKVARVLPGQSKGTLVLERAAVVYSDGSFKGLTLIIAKDKIEDWEGQVRDNARELSRHPIDVALLDDSKAGS